MIQNLTDHLSVSLIIVFATFFIRLIEFSVECIPVLLSDGGHWFVACAVIIDQKTPHATWNVPVNQVSNILYENAKVVLNLSVCPFGEHPRCSQWEGTTTPLFGRYVV